MQQQTWRTAAVLLMSLAAPMILSAQTPSKGGAQFMIVGSGREDSTKSDPMKGADSAKAATPSKGGQAVIQMQMGGRQGQVITIPMNQIQFSVGPAAPAKKDSTKACAVDSTGKGNAGSCDQKKSDSTAATPSR